MKKIFLVRHGLTDQNQQRRYCGLTDVSLSSRGIHQAGLVAGELAKENFASIFTSPLKRALTTANQIAQAHGISPETLTGLTEIDFGSWEGLTFDEIQKTYPDRLNDWFKKPDTFTFPQGESVADFRKRVLASMETILDRQGDSLIVAHGGSLRIMICHLCRWSMDNIHSFELEPASLTILKHYDESTVAAVLNQTSHLKNGEPS